MTLVVERTSPTTLRVSRYFAAPPERIFAAHMEPAIIRRWLLGPDGWTMPVCENDPRVGGRIRYEWRNTANDAGFYLTGEYLVVEAPHRTVHVERMHLPEPTPDNTVETTFTPEGAGTRMVITMSVGDAGTMDAMVATGMTDGMEASYARLESEAASGSA